MKNGQMNLKFWTKPSIVVDKNGKKNEMLEVAECDCLFSFEYQFKNLPAFSATSITINGLTPREINSNNRFIEIKVKIDK